jgi:hypothetical protein
MDPTLAFALEAVHREHTAVTHADGWTDCACGWEANHPLLATTSEQRHFDDPNHPDPSDRTGAPDPAHMTDDAQIAHVAALMADAAVALSG